MPEREIAWAYAGGDRPAGPAAVMRRAHREKRRLCAALERIAAGPADAPDRLACLRVAAVLMPLLRSLHRYEERTLFPAFLAVGGRLDAGTLQRLRAEHAESELAALEVTETLMGLGRGAPPPPGDTLAGLLGSFSADVLRHIAEEEDHVLPALAGLCRPVLD